jgi:glycosyltransferase involved in cell wall biosynthesis
MRILILSNVPPSSLGGAEVQAMNLARRWSESGHEVLVAGYANQPFEDRNLRILTLPTTRAFKWARGVTYLLATLSLIWTRRYEFDIVYCRFLKEQAIAACIAKMLFHLDQPIVACPASAGLGGDVSVLNRRFLKRLWIGLFSRQLDCINAMTQRIYADVKTVGISVPRIARIPNGTVIPDRRAPVERSPGQIRLIFVGRLVEEKGIDVLLEAASLLQSRGYSFALEIVGDGPLRKRLEALGTSRGLEGIVKFSGQVLPADVASHLVDSDIFVLPSRFEGMPGSLLEAFSHGLPAVVTRVSGSEEIVDRDTGWVVPPGDARLLAEALATAIDYGGGGLRRMGEAARLKAMQHYDIETVARDYEELFADLLNNLRPNPGQEVT